MLKSTSSPLLILFATYSTSLSSATYSTTLYLIYATTLYLIYATTLYQIYAKLCEPSMYKCHIGFSYCIIEITYLYAHKLFAIARCENNYECFAIEKLKSMDIFKNRIFYYRDLSSLKLRKIQKSEAKMCYICA